MVTQSLSKVLNQNFILPLNSNLSSSFKTVLYFGYSHGKHSVKLLAFRLNQWHGRVLKIMKEDNRSQQIYN